MLPKNTQGPGRGALVLRKILARRCAHNPKYSLRAFARSLGVSHATLSLILSGRREVSRRLTARLLELGDLHVSERRALLATGSESSESLDLVMQDHLALATEWEHAAVLSLLQLSGARFEARWIARRLAIPEIQARLVIERLQRNGLVSKTYGRWRAAALSEGLARLESLNATPAFQHRLLERALEALKSAQSRDRHFFSDVLLLDERQVAIARQRLEQLRQDLASEQPAKGRSARVFGLCLQLFALDQPD